MEWENPGIPRPRSAPNPIPHASPFTGQPLPSGYMGPESGRAPLGYFRGYNHTPEYHLYSRSHPRPAHHSLETQDAICREIEKEQIRDEIIMLEMVRRRTLEAEVRRELMIERELALRQGNERFLNGSTSSMGFNSPAWPLLLGPAEDDSPMKKRIVPTPLESSRHETGGYDAWMAPRWTGNLRISEVDPVAEIGKEKEKIILQVKPDVNISGLKRKAITPLLEVDSSESPLDDPLRKKSKTEWTCDICHINTTSEKGLKDHLQGKKHKAKEDALKVQVPGKNYCIGFFPKNDTNPVQIADLQNRKKSASGSLQIQKAADTSSEKGGTPKLQENRSRRNSKRSKKMVDKEGQNSDVSKKIKFKYWCEMCQAGAFTSEIMNAHKQGKKHARLAQISSKKAGDCDTMHEAKKRG